MSLPGKFCIGILEEDNPLKSYFRFKPLLVAEEGRYVPFSEPDTYPQDSCIRIVPDKNEAYHFKARMRRMGLFCVVDLRAHPDENDKIRPNKNYREDGPERNAFIIYSDVVKEPAPGLILELLPESMADKPCPMPRTAQVLLKGEEPLPERLCWEPLPDDETIGALKPTGELCPLDRAQLFDLPTFGEQTVAFAILPPPEPDPVPAPRPVDAAHRPAEPLRAPQEVAAPRAPIPQPVAEPHRPDHAPADAKPWIHHDDSMLPRPVDPRLSPAQRSLAAQSGLNPRRGRSLQERARLLISIAHPDDREMLEREAFERFGPHFLKVA